MEGNNYIGTSQRTEDPPGYVKSYGQRRRSFERSVAKRTSRCGVATRRDPITFETEEESKDPKSIRWEEARAGEEGNS